MNKIFWVDWHNKVLPETEFAESSFISYCEVTESKTPKKTELAYLKVENQIAEFLLDIFQGYFKSSNLKVKYRAEQPFSKCEVKKMNKWEIRFSKTIIRNWVYTEIDLSCPSELESLIRFALREKIKLIINFDKAFFSSGYDLCLYFQNIKKKKLKKFTNKHNLYILGEWEDNLWTQAT